MLCGSHFWMMPYSSPGLLGSPNSTIAWLPDFFALSHLMSFGSRNVMIAGSGSLACIKLRGAQTATAKATGIKRRNFQCDILVSILAISIPLFDVLRQARRIHLRY